VTASFGGGDVERQRGIAQAISLLALGGGALVVFLFHWWERPARSEPGPEPVEDPAPPAPIAMA
jgi:hypothetical protein